jgi:hypothetical protein
MNIKEWLIEIFLEGTLIIFGILLLLLLIFLNFPNLPGKLQPLQSYLQISCLVLAVISFALGAVLWARNFRKMRIPRNYRPRADLRNVFLLNKKCDILHGGIASVYDYSNYADRIKNDNHPSNIFTVCAFEPHEILNYILPRYNERLRSFQQPTLLNVNGLATISDNDFLSQAMIDFPHFQSYQEFFSKGGNIERVLVLRDEMAISRNPKWMFEKFKILNGNIPCSVVYRNVLEKLGIAFLTDFVVYDGEFVIDYYADSNTFILSYLKKKDDPVKQRLLALINHYQQNRTNKVIYQPLDELI